jgi:3-hydroxyisobutyrate dehydrogenase
MTAVHGVPARIGFVGTGLIGTPMVERLLECGRQVTVWNRTAAKADALVALGAHRAESLADLAARSDIIALCLTNTDAVRAVVFGDGGLASVSSAAHVLVDHSSIDPIATQEMAHTLADRAGTAWVDGPVSGGLPAARAGTLIIFAGGDASDLARAEPLFSALSSRVTHMGASGAGQLAKSCNQMVVACNLLVIAEMLAFAEAHGLDASRLPAALAGGFADSRPLQIFGPRMAARTETPRMGAIATFRKDIEQVVRLAAERGSATPMSARAVELFRAIADDRTIGGDADVSALIRHYRPAVPGTA